MENAHCYRAVVLAAMLAGCHSAPAAELMPVAQQNLLVRKYCTVCHTDAARNGGLSLEHFDAAKAAPSLVAMMLSKLTGGVTLEMARAAGANGKATALVDTKMRSGAMGAAGIPRPGKATIDALIHAFAVESIGATEWTVERAKEGTEVKASILREAPSTKNAGETEVYRLIVSCNAATREGTMQLAWSPVPQSGTFTASVDGSTAVTLRAEGSEKMGNGSGVVLHGLAALVLSDSKGGLPLPAESLTTGDLFPGETITFPFANLSAAARQELAACFLRER